jgi:Type II CAAX prenyl endopeptidase Rce1-like
MLAGMRDSNQETSDGSPGPGSFDAPANTPSAAGDNRLPGPGHSPVEPGAPLPELEAPRALSPELGTPDVSQGLTWWLILIVGLGLLSVTLGQNDVAMLAVLTGLCVAAQAADADPRWRVLHSLLAWIVPVGGAVMLGAMGFLLADGGTSGPGAAAMIGLCAGGSLTSLMVALRPFANALVAFWFRSPPSHTLRLAVRIVFIGLVMAVPMWLALRVMLDSIMDDLGSLLEGAGFGLGLVGYILLAFASVGLWIRRGLPESLKRLGVGPIHQGHVLAIVLGVGALLLFNTGFEMFQRRFFTDAWLDDQRINQSIRSGLGLPEMLMLGISAGIGEEITMRGALQPRLGLFWTSLLFAMLHVQYSWFGIAVIFSIGLVLGLIRNRTNTTVAMAIHTLYDIIAVLSIESPT